MMRRNSIGRQAAIRLGISLSLLVVLIALSSMGIYRAALHKAAQERADELVRFYTARLDQIDREWEIRSRDFKVRIEFTRALEDPSSALTNLQAFMTIQGADRPFQYLLIQTEDGKKLFDFGKDISLPLIPSFGEGSIGHYLDPDNQQIYRLFIHPIWLGEERGMGRFAAFIRIDNALLNQMRTPGLTLGVLHQGELVASSGGQASLDALRQDLTTADSERETRQLPWGDTTDDAISLFIEAPITTLFSTMELSLGMSIIPLVDGLVLWFTIGLWLMRQTRRITDLGGAVAEYAFARQVSAAMTIRLTNAKQKQTDEIAEVAVSIGAMVEAIDQREREREEAVEQLRASESRLLEAKGEAERANLAKSEFLANMSHEIRTPLNAIVGMAEQLKESAFDSEQQRCLKVLELNSDALLCTINDIIDLSKVDVGRIDLEEAPFNIIDLLEKSAEMIALKAHKKGLELHTVLAPEIPVIVVGDMTRLRQILVNLLGNAIKFTFQGEIIVKCAINKMPSPEDKEVDLIFSVSDTGIGVPEDKLESIFERFSQADTSTTREFGGTGLGLTISHRLCQLMQGMIWAESEVGRGSTFYFTAKVKLAPEPVQTVGTLYGPLDNNKILVVDENSTNRTILREILQGWNVEMDEAGDGISALQYSKEAEQNDAPYDFALLDCRLSGLDAFQVAKHFQEDLRNNIVTALMLTADERRSKPERYKEAGIKGYLVKPVKRAELYTFLSKISEDSGFVSPATTKASQELFLDMSVIEPMTILLAEDFIHNRLVVQQYLKNLPFKLDIVENGAQAVEKFKAAVYDLILIDMQMPVMDGYTATREIRKIEKERDISPVPIIALSAYALKEEIDRSMEAGCTEYLTKPLKKAVLLKTLSRYAKVVPQSEKTDVEFEVMRPRDDMPTNGMQGERLCLDQDFAEFIPKFLDDVHESICFMEDALAKNDYDFILNTSHRIKGAGGGYGLDVVSKFAQAIEMAARKKNEAKASIQLEKLASYIQHIEITYK
jgi:signal transduction histidine kinase/DNA-binding response OmpR family regulator